MFKGWFKKKTVPPTEVDLSRVVVADRGSPVYAVFEDERRFQPWGPLHPEYTISDAQREFLETHEPNRYDLNDEFEFWFDGAFNRVSTSAPDLYLQIFVMRGAEGWQRRVFVGLHGRRVQFSAFDNTNLKSPYSVPPKTKDGKKLWSIEEIGAPLNVFVGDALMKRGVKASRDEMFQCLTNSDRFKNKADLDMALLLITRALETYGSIFSDVPAYGHETPGEAMVEFSQEVLSGIESGRYVD